MKDVSIIFVNYKTPILTRDAIKSIIDKSSGFSYEIIVVDNSNSEADFLELKKELAVFADAEIKIIDAHGNLGFGKANNLGVKESNAEFVFLLNTDTLLVNNAIFELWSFMKNHLDAGVVGSNLFSLNGEPNHSFAAKEKNAKNEKKTNSLLTSLISKLTRKRPDFNYSDTPKEIQGYCCGASMMMSKADFDKLGGFDKDIFMYAEESLLQLRVRRELNKKIYNIPSSKIIHLEGQSQEAESYDKLKRYYDGNLLYYMKAFGVDETRKFLKMTISSSKRRSVIAKMLGKNQKYIRYTTIINVCEDIARENDIVL